ncbi:MAG: hypothetical protein ACHQK8_06910 [Bacteroidia bacterium]
MKARTLLHAFRNSQLQKQLVIALMLMFTGSAYAQLANPNESNQTSSNNHFVYDDQPAVTVFVSPEAASTAAVSLISNSTPEINDVTVWDNSVENHLLILTVNTMRMNLSAVVYDANGNRVMLETPIDPGSYRMVEHTRDLKPGTYYLHILEKGQIIEKQKFTVK